MNRMMKLALACLGLLLLAGPALAQESKAADATRKKLQQKINLDIKEEGTKVFFDLINLEIDKPLKFVIDNKSGVSNNSKLSYKGKGVTIEKVLNDVSDKYDFGWVVISNPSNNRVDGSIVIRKAKEKERGYEDGKKGASLAPANRSERDARLSPSPSARGEFVAIRPETLR